MKLATAALCLVAAVLSGCVETVFESQPGKNNRSCDSNFVGTWQLARLSERAEPDENLFIVIEPQCKALHSFDNGKTDAQTDAKIHLGFASIGAKSILTVKFDAEPKHTNATDWSNGYHYFLYEVRGNDILLRAADDKQVAHWIIEGKLSGRTEKVSRMPGGKFAGDGATLHNYVAGDAEAMASAVELPGLFSDTTSIILKRATHVASPASAKP